MNEAQEEGNNSVKAQLRGETRCGWPRPRACPSRQGVRFERGTCQKLGTLHHRGERTREVGEGDSDAEFADLALCPHAVRVDPPQGAKIASQAVHVDENRPISGRLGRSRGRPIFASQRVTDAFRDMLDLASRREDTRRDG